MTTHTHSRTRAREWTRRRSERKRRRALNKPKVGGGKLRNGGEPETVAALGGPKRGGMCYCYSMIEKEAHLPTREREREEVRRYCTILMQTADVLRRRIHDVLLPCAHQVANRYTWGGEERGIISFCGWPCYKTDDGALRNCRWRAMHAVDNNTLAELLC